MGDKGEEGLKKSKKIGDVLIMECPTRTIVYAFLKKTANQHL